MATFLAGVAATVVLLIVFAKPIGRWLERQTARLNRLSERIDRRH
jgi:HAMP domain-containing protein